MSHISVLPSLQMGPNVSSAIGTKVSLLVISVYLTRFLAAAFSAAAPGVVAVVMMYEAAKESVTVTSQVKHFPPDHGISVSPSGRLPSARVRPTGSLVVGMPASVKARHIISF